jgi:hypothetical protein
VATQEDEWVEVVTHLFAPAEREPLFAAVRAAIAQVGILIPFIAC